MDYNIVLLFSAALTLLVTVLLFAVLRQSARENERNRKELSDLERELKDCYHRLSEENRAIAKQCAIKAIENPLSITTIE